MTHNGPQPSPTGDSSVTAQRKPKEGGLNRWGYYICGDCRSGNHVGVAHVGLCSCSCDGRHDSKGRLLDA